MTESKPEPWAVSLPRLLFVTGSTHGIEEYFYLSAVHPWVEGLGHHFQVEVVQDAASLEPVAEKFAPDLVVFFGAKYHLLYEGPLLNFRERLGVPVAALTLMDAHSTAREGFFVQVQQLGVEAVFTIDTGMREMAGDFEPLIFYCPWFVNEKMSRDFALPKTVPLALIGDGFVASGDDWRYPWRREVGRRLREKFLVFTAPRPTKNHSHKLVGAEYGKMLNRSWLALACGASRHIFMKKNLEIPASRSCLVSEPNETLRHLGFRDEVNCLFATADDIEEKCRAWLSQPDRLLELTDRGRTFVLENHHARNRTVMADWLALRQRLSPGDRILQTEVMGPLKIVATDDPTESIRLSSQSPFEQAMEAARENWRRAAYGECEQFAQRAQTLLPHATEPQFLLAWAALGQDLPEVALMHLRAILLRHVRRGAIRPDPLVWGSYILALALAGLEKEAILFAQSFPEISHPLLERARAAVLGAAWQETNVPTPSVLHSPWETVAELDCFLAPGLDKIRLRQLAIASS